MSFKKLHHISETLHVNKDATHNPGLSSSLIFRFFKIALTVISYHKLIRSELHRHSTFCTSSASSRSSSPTGPCPPPPKGPNRHPRFHEPGRTKTSPVLSARGRSGRNGASSLGGTNRESRSASTRRNGSRRVRSSTRCAGSAGTGGVSAESVSDAESP